MSPSRTRHFVRRVLATWTGVLILLIVSASRAIPPIVLAFLLPYLALVAWYMLAPPGQVEMGRVPIPEDSASPPLPDLDPEFATSAPSASLEVGAYSSEVSESNPAPDSEEPSSTTAPVRARRRVKPKAVPEPSPASWVQVGPGRFIRGEEPQPFLGSLVEVEPVAHSPETPPDLADDGPLGDPLADDAATQGLVVEDTAGLSKVPVAALAESEPGDAPVPLEDDQDHVSTIEGVLADSARMPGSSSSSVGRPGVANATPGSNSKG